ncbi:MAG: hypothetical protein DRJ10_15545 [Bacteroidetes bacterium]|nr:MAG: hypothetical protein DRJ10_15545 [Bacteroidota bacterium]
MNKSNTKLLKNIQMKKILFILLIGFAFTLNANAQDDSYEVSAIKSYSSNYPNTIWNFDYSMGFGMGDFREFIDETSFRGFYMDGRAMINEKISIGGGLGWNVYNQSYDRETYEFNGGAITGQKWNYFFQLPLFMNAHYYFTHHGMIQPRIGISTGGYYTEYEIQMGTFSLYDKEWKFGITPEVEVFIPFGASHWGFNVRGKYNYIFYNDNRIDGLQHFTVDVGFTFAL